ncbi:O-antigen ligase family protein [Nonomuraea africana]|uniref:O-antigen ligase n=1 Tax=Nonomuraea africana TaxID=46171 RepID=A0ABR9KPD1_9ACTN|nr:O-antigen ligase family protein [Nonomuraea africana]MBE1563874.1 O-antigen ligase [Nonomuraea africana]
MRDLLSTTLARGPSLLAALTVLLTCLPSGQGNPGAAVHVTMADVASAALIAVAAACLAGGRPRLPQRALVLAPLALAVTAATLTSADALTSMPGYLRYLQVFVLIPLAVLVTLREKEDAWLVGGALVAAAAVQGAVGCYQALTATGASYGGERVRAVGTFGALDVMGMATVVSYGLIILFALGLTLRGRPRIAALAGSGLLAVPLVLSLSRGTWLALLCAVLVMLVRYGARSAARVVLVASAGAVVLVFGFGVGSDTIGQRLASITSSISQPDQSVSDRYSLWQTAGAMWQHHPLTGVGPRRFAELRDSYAPTRLSSGSDTDDPVNGFQRQPLLSPHNMYLLVLSEQGVLGLAAFVFFFGALLLWTSMRRGVVVAGLLTWQMVDFAYSDIGGAPTLVMAVMLGLALTWATDGWPR